MNRRTILLRLRGDQGVGCKIASEATVAEQRKKPIKSRLAEREELHMFAIQPMANGGLGFLNRKGIVGERGMSNESDKSDHNYPGNSDRFHFQ